MGVYKHKIFILLYSFGFLLEKTTSKNSNLNLQSMETQENQQEHHTIQHQAHTFTLTPINSQSPKFEANFSPLKCKNSCKYIKAIPTYNQKSQISFCTEVDRLTLKKTQSLQYSRNKQNLAPSNIFLPKPSHNYCQVCKQRYNDYLQHISHPIHKRRSQETSNQYNLDSLKELLSTIRKSERKATSIPHSPLLQLSEYSLDSCPISSKDSNLKMEDMDKLSFAISTNHRQMGENVCQEPGSFIQRQKYSDFRRMENQHTK